jgi:hypothetical protein
MPCVRQVLRERGKPPETSRLPPGNGQSAVLVAPDVAVQRLHRSLHTRKWLVPFEIRKNTLPSCGERI